MKRTAADFARDATLDVWIYTTSIGRDLTPRPKAFFTFDEQAYVARNNLTWFEYANSTDSTVPDDLESSFMVEIKLRFSRAGELLAAIAEKRTPELPDFDAFWAEAKDMPLGDATVDPEHRIGLTGLIAELDGFYKGPLPAEDREAADAETDPAGAAAGKSGSAPTS